jgi:RHS repeat-associated protein
MGSPSYRLEGAWDAFPGPISRLRLPTGGAITWDYVRVFMPQPRPDDDGLYLWSIPTWSDVIGVSRRSLYAEGDRHLGDWLYGASYSDTIGLRNELVREVRYPPSELGQSEGHRVLTYYSACPYYVCQNEAGGEPPNTYAEDYGLPFSRRQASDGSGRFLSQEIFAAGASTPMRRIFAAYENDGDPSHPACNAQPDCFSAATNQNQRLQSQRTVFLDDFLPGSTTNTWVLTVNSLYDGVGHYRQTSTSDNFGQGATHTEVTHWNPNGRPAQGQPWILNTYDYREQSAGSSVQRQEFTFEADTGFLLCRRSLKGGTSRGAFDVVVAFDHADPELPGQLTSEKWYGGDTQQLDTAADCGNLPQLAKYAYVHDYEFGARKRTYVNVASIEGVGELELLDIDVDQNTGWPSASRDSAHRLTTFVRDDMGRLESISAEGDATTTIDYDADGSVPPLIVATVGETLDRKEWALDGVGRVVGTSAALPDDQTSSTLTLFNALGWKTLVTEPGSSKGTKYSGFDPFGKPAVVEAADGKVTRFDYKGNRVVLRTSPVWNGTREVQVTTREEYDGLGRLRQIRQPNGTWHRYAYDVGGRLATVVNNSGSGNTQSRTFVYDGRGFLTKEVQPESGIVTYQYDARGNVTRKGTPTGTMFLGYDEAGRLTRVTSPQADLQLMGYRANGEIAWARSLNYRKVDNQCRRFEVRQDFAFSSLHGRLESKATTLWQEGVAAPLEQWAQAYEYDGTGQITGTTYPHCSAPCSAPVRHRTTQYEKGRPTRVPTFADAITYHPNGLVETVQHSNGVVMTQTIDPSSGMARPYTLRAQSGGIILWPLEDYSYDGSGNITRVGAKKFTYDASSRLLSALVPSAATPYQAYSYDVFGNLNRVSQGATPQNITSYVDYTANSATNRLQGATYDNAGNLTGYQGSAYTWDLLGNMSTIDTGSERWVHTYDTAGERVWSWRTTGTRLDTFALRGQGGQVLTDFTKTGSTYGWEDYVYRGVALLGAVRSDGLTRHFDVDHLGNVRLETYGDGSVKAYREFWPYGDIAMSSAPLASDTEQMKFTGHERDLGDPASTADDIDYMHARYYKPLFARFLSPDKIGGGLAAPQSWNRYSYVIGNPLRYTDPKGLLPQCDSPANGNTPTCWEGIEVVTEVAPTAADIVFSEGFTDHEVAPYSPEDSRLYLYEQAAMGETWAVETLRDAQGIQSGSLEWLVASFLIPAAPGVRAAAGAADEGLAAASNAAFKAADSVDSFVIPAKHLPGAGGRYAKFAAGTDAKAAIADALRSGEAVFLSNGGRGFRIVANLGRQVGSRGETGVRVILGFDGKIWTAFPVRP